MAYERRDLVGGAVVTTLAGTLLTGGTSTSITANTGWASGTNGKFYAVVDEGLSGEEKILITSRTGSNLTGISRAQDGTTESDHQIGATIRLVLTAKDLDEANYAVNKTVGKVTTIGDLLVADAANSFTRLANGTSGRPLLAGASTPAYGQIAAGGIADDAVTTAKILNANVTLAKMASEAWSSYTPTLVQSGAVTKTVTAAAYVQMGRLVVVNLYLAVTGTGTTNNTIAIGLPVTAARSSGLIGSATVFDNSALSHRGSVARLVSTTTFDILEPASGVLNPVGQTPNFALGSSDTIAAMLMYEAAS